jgi:hypothetical protein
MNDYKAKMKNEIEARLESEAWNLSIAHEVLQRIQIKEEKNIFNWSIASAITAFAFILIFIFNVYFYFTNTTVSEYNLYSYSSASSLIGEISEVDLVINEVFPMR